MRHPLFVQRLSRCGAAPLASGRFVLQGVALFVAALVLHAAEAPRKSFRIGAGEATDTLKQFSVQAGGDRLLYSIDAVEGVQTKSIEGEFTPREALERMLDGSGLIVAEDARSGALTVRRRETRPAAPTQGKRPPPRVAGPAADGDGDDSPIVAEPRSSGTGTIRGRVQNVATGQYLNNARITVAHADIEAFTDQAGEFILTGVPAGDVLLDVFYTGLDAQKVTVTVPTGGEAEVSVRLTSADRYGRDGAVITLDSFVVTSSRETEGEALATNEQRFAPNIKNVVATDSLGDIMGNSVGEFLKFLPGLTAEYTDAEITGVSIRGIGGEMTNFSADGAPMASASTSSTRSFQLLNIALNNISRIEVTKVPTPAVPADSLGGSVNLVSKSAFERAQARLHYCVNVSGSNEDLTLRKTPHTFEKNTRKILPGFDFDYTLPITKNFGLLLAGMHSNRFNEQHLATTSYNTGGTATGASLQRPFFQNFTLNDGPRNSMRNSASLKLDWRVARSSVLSVGAQATHYANYIGTIGWAIDTGTNGNSTPAGRVPFSFGDTFTNGATGRGSLGMSSSFQTLRGLTHATSITYRHDDGRWRIETGLNRTGSKRIRADTSHGHFRGITIANLNPVRVAFGDITRDRPGTIQVFDNNNAEIDPYDLANYRLTGVSDNPYQNRAGVTSGDLNVRRRIGWFRFPAAVQIGGRQKEETRDTRLESISWTYNGLDGNASTIETPVPYASQVYRNQDSHYGFHNIPWVSPHLMYRAWIDNPQLFSQTPSQTVSQESNRIQNSEWMKERVSAAYVQADVSLFNNRLRLLGGVRYEKTTDEGDGPLYDPNAVWLRNANGSFQHNAAGGRIRNPAAGAVGSMEELRLIRQERAYHGKRSYDGSYPSIHATYRITDNLQLRGAYAATYGRPDFSNIIPNATVNEADLDEDELDDPNAIRGSITMRNTGLKPWSADNFDVSLEYYTDRGGLFTAGVFMKDIKDFFAEEVRIANAADLQDLGLDSRYLGWRITTKFNSGAARIKGAEFHAKQGLGVLGSLGRALNVFVNGTRLNLEGHSQADFSTFIRSSANWGFMFTRSRVVLIAKWNYRGLDKRTTVPSFGPDAFQYFAPRTTLDFNSSYQLGRRVALTASIGNVFNVPQRLLRFGAQTPDYAKQYRTSEYGVSFTIGVKGDF